MQGDRLLGQLGAGQNRRQREPERNQKAAY